MAADWEKIGQPRWYDWKLGRMNDKRLARLVGTTQGVIRYRRHLFGIPAFSVALLIEPFRHLLGIESDREIAARCGTSASSVKGYRESLGVSPKARPEPRKPNILFKRYRLLLGLVGDTEVAELGGVPVEVVEALRCSLGIEPCQTRPDPAVRAPIPNYQGPWLGYESLFGTLSTAKISRTVGVPFTVVERRRLFLGATPYKRLSRVAPYEHLLGVVSNNLVAKLAGVTPARIADIRRAKGI